MSVSFNVYAGPAIRIPVEKHEAAESFCEQVFDGALWCYQSDEYYLPDESEGQRYVYLLPNNKTVFPFGKTYDRHGDLEPITFQFSLKTFRGEDLEVDSFMHKVLDRVVSIGVVEDFHALDSEPFWVVLPYFM